MLPVLLRPGGMRRGEVILSGDEAWDLMSTTGPRLLSAGFDVRAPEISRRASRASLRVHVDSVQKSTVGANQLADVRWSAVFDDVELTAADIARLAKEARPVIRASGRWVALDQVDLKAGAEALAEREKKQLSGGEMLRLALGLDDSPFSGRVSIDGGGWAADLLRAAAKVGTEPARKPRGFKGDLRSYQAEALAWLGFLDSVRLGGSLALCMGLGKRRTLLANVLRNPAARPTLVITPPAEPPQREGAAPRPPPRPRVFLQPPASPAPPP